jgi:hypothetical protein
LSKHADHNEDYGSRKQQLSSVKGANNWQSQQEPHKPRFWKKIPSL